jgi:PAS domain S-box-containing protein
LIRGGSYLNEIDAARLLEEAPVALSLLDRHGAQIDANPAYLKLFGLSPDRLHEIGAMDVTHPSEAARTRTYLDELVEGSREQVEVEKRYVRADGSEFTGRLRAVALRSPDGSVVALLGTIEDITEVHQHRAELEQGRNRMSSLLENINDSVTVVDAAGVVLDGTGFFDDVLGYPSGYWADRSVWDLTDPNEHPRLIEKNEQLMSQPGERVQFDVRLRDVTGTWHDIEVTAVNLLADPTIGGIVLTTRNITQRKAMEAELAEQRDRALEEARIRSEFTARATHELRNQIHALAGLSDLVSSANVPEDVRELAEQASRTAGRLQHLVEDLLDFSRLRTGPPRPRLRSVDVSALVADLSAIGRSLACSGVEVVTEIHEDLPETFHLDESLVSQILANLVSNAAKFTEEGRIAIAVRSASIDGRCHLVWSVSDTGRGIPAEDHRRIFETFEQLRGSDQFGGLGLGLAITSQLVSHLDGTITLDSELGRGSTFTVTIPCPTQEELAPVDSPAGSLPSASLDARVLVVEDDAVNQLLVREQLKRMGATATVVGDGADAVALIESGEEFDLVLMDWELPEMDGLSATRRIRELEGSDERHPILGLTANTTATDREACLRAGMDDVLEKPLAFHDLEEAVRSFARPDDTRPSIAALDPERPSEAQVRPALERLVDELGGTSPVHRIVSTYLAELPGRLQAITVAVDTEDPELLRQSAHRLRAVSRTLGAGSIDDSARALEEAEFPPTAAMLEGLDRVADAVAQEMHAWLAGGLEEVLR